MAYLIERLQNGVWGFAELWADDPDPEERWRRHTSPDPHLWRRTHLEGRLTVGMLKTVLEGLPDNLLLIWHTTGGSPVSAELARLPSLLLVLKPPVLEGLPPKGPVH